MKTQLTTTDYSEIAKMILANTPDEDSRFEVEYITPDYSVFVEVDYQVSYRTVIGGSYEGYDFEYLSEIDRESIEAVSAEMYDNEGDFIQTLNLNELNRAIN